MYSLIVTAKLNDVDPQAWLVPIFRATRMRHAVVGDDRLHRCHADLFDEQLSLLVMPLSVAEGRRIAGIALASNLPLFRDRFAF